MRAGLAGGDRSVIIDARPVRFYKWHAEGPVSRTAEAAEARQK